MAAAANPDDELKPVKSATDPATQVEVVAEKTFIQDAQDATNDEHGLTFVQAIKLYPKAVGWSMLLSSALIMEGYDLKLMVSMFAQPSFRKKYGVLQPNGTYQITAPWQAGLTNGANVGALFGLYTAGHLADRFGFRKTMIASLSALACFIFIQFFAPSLVVLEIGQILVGIPLGVFQSVTTHYAVEVTPTCLRGYLTTYVNLCWVLGQLTASCVMRGMLTRTDQWSYRIPFAIQWVWPIPLIIGIYLAPESPWWLVRHGKMEEAKSSLLRLTSRKKVNYDVNKAVALMVVTTEYERMAQTGTTYLSLFRGTNLRRTIIVMGCYSAQMFCGAGFRNYSTYFYQQAGLPTEQAFNMAIIQYALGVIGVFIAWALLPTVGRRTLYLWGFLGMGACHFATGGIGVGYANHKATGLAWAAGSMLLLFTFIYDVTVGPVAYALVSEIPSVLLRSKSIVIARMTYSSLSIFSNTITPYMLNPTAWNWGARAGFFWAGTCVIGLVFTFFMIPETKDRTFVELDILFEKNISARGFANTEVTLDEVRHHHSQA